MFFQSVVCDLGVQKKRLGMESQEEEVPALWGWKEAAEDLSLARPLVYYEVCYEVILMLKLG